jgi:hypothetical protein
MERQNCKEKMSQGRLIVVKVKGSTLTPTEEVQKYLLEEAKRIQHIEEHWFVID